MIKEKIIELLKKASGQKEIEIEIPQSQRFGDYSTNLAMKMASIQKKNPLESARWLIQKLPKGEFFEKVEISPPGFINFYLSKEWLAEQLLEIIARGENYGRSFIGQKKKVLLEFVSANPTGPLTLGNARGGFLGDVLANVLEAAGYQVKREYYVNDTGRQIEILGTSVLKAKTASGVSQSSEQDKETPLYRGEYIEEIAKKINETNPQAAGKKAAQIILSDIIKKTLREVGIRFDSWVFENSLIESGAVWETIQELEKRGMVYQKEGAVWFCSSKLGDDKDRVLRKKNGEYTYFASDLAYHINKVKRGFDLLIDIWGADHFGDVPRIMAGAKIFGFQDKLKIIIHQFVRLYSGGRTVRMSKRKGQYLTLSELIDKVGLAAVRFFFLTKAAATHLNFDLERAAERSERNPVYYIQYAGARIFSVFRQLEKLEKEGFTLKKDPKLLKLLNHPAEISLMKQLVRFPDLIAEIATDYQVQKLPFFAYELATAFHNFYEQCRILNKDEPGLTGARFILLKATFEVLRNTHQLLGIEMVEKM